ncbi:MAG: dipicolinate synthase subunit B [Firmicutes bacterium]|uniref:Dipicolinate synthase subunit B n=1 Tax=Melghirimyces thermohalophilus TaxID=1236220 RepID=A0A1G6J1W2_9BACL|nr:dipicolinate synthase subunit B [Melghirimyces thermohalophilus]MDA8352362.1 dipicolinate synthase subunit B [Bacillota bacterium]SDC12768.1 dipicolinate synthase subunit B [Melghirimyces thermohalophilus]
MNLKGKTVGFGMTGSHCTHDEVLPQMERLVKLGARVIPILSHTVQTVDSKFGEAAEWLRKIRDITDENMITSIPEAEPIGPKKLLDCMVIAPCTGSSLSRLANAQTDSPVLMGAKAQMRNQRPVVVAISTNDALGLNAANLARLLPTRHIYFVPFGQDAPEQKPNSLVARMEMIPETIEAAMNGKQIQPLIVEKYRDLIS